MEEGRLEEKIKMDIKEINKIDDSAQDRDYLRVLLNAELNHRVS